MFRPLAQHSHSRLLEPRDYLEIAAIAASRSADPSTQNGAVIVNQTGGLAVGWNRFAPGLEVTPERLTDRDTKLLLTTHAEESSIIAAAAASFDLSQSTMYCLWAACTRCARAIIEARIGVVVTLLGYYDMSPERWRGDIDKAGELLQEAGVLVVKTRLPLPDAARNLRFNGDCVAAQYPRYETYDE